MRFAISHVLDAIERHASIDPLLAGAVLNLDEIVRLNELDSGPRPTTLRLGLVIDALGRYLGDSTAAVYTVADRSLLSDIELSSNERMAIRRWADDGRVEVLPAGAPLNERVGEISVLTGLPVISRNPGFGDGRLVPTVAAGGVVLKQASASGRPPAPSTNPVMSRWWRCREPDCPAFGTARRQGAGQAPPHVAGGKPFCPRHGVPLADGGPRPPAQAMAVRIGGVVRHRFAVSTQPVVVGRSPDAAAPDTTVKLGPYLDDIARRRVSRSHVRLEIRPEGLTVTDISTNGTAVYARTAPDETGVRTPLTRDQPHQLGRWETVQLYVGVELGRAGQKWAGASEAPATSVMADAPTMAIRLPRG